MLFLPAVSFRVTCDSRGDCGCVYVSARNLFEAEGEAGFSAMFVKNEARGELGSLTSVSFG